METNNHMNFSVFQASAGSGKTYTIVKEYLKLCLGDERQVDNFRHILAITFTNASANDMKAKIVRELVTIIESDGTNPNPMSSDLINELSISEDELKANAKHLLTLIMHDYSSFCVCTIDAFVQKLSRSFAHDLGLPSQYTVSIDADDVAESVVESLGSQISDENPFLVQLLKDFSNDRFASQKSTRLEGLLGDFVIKLMNEKAYQKDGMNNIKDVVQYKQTLAFLSSQMESFARRVKGFVEDFQRLERDNSLTVGDYAYGRTGFWSFVNKLTTRQYDKPSSRFLDVASTGKWYSTEAKKRIPNSDLERVGTTIQTLFATFLEDYSQEFGRYLFYKSQRDLLYLYALRSKIGEEFARLAQEEEVVHISEFNKLLHDVMGDFSVPFVYERIGERFQHIFVDEFQDTSIMQWHNILPLVDNGLSMGKMSMVVGDGKQSIYRFRNGEVGQIAQLPEIYALPEDERSVAFRQYQTNLENAFSFHSLETNYRSFRKVVEFNNAFFEKTHQLLSPELQKVYKDDNQRFGKMVSIAQKANKKADGMVQMELYDSNTRPDYCFERIGQLIEELLAYGYRYQDITILTRKTSLGADIANYLNDMGVPVVSQVSILLKSSNKVQLLVNTLRFLLYPDNEVYVSNLLYYRRLTVNDSFDGQVDGLFDEVKAIAEGRVSVESILGWEGDVALVDVFAKATCLYDLCASLMRLFNIDTVNDAYLDYFMEEVNQWQSNLNDSTVDFLNYWEQKQEILSVKSVGGNALNITTIHKSKGLQYPVVIYPDAIIDLDERLNQSKATEEWVSPQELGFAAIPNVDQALFRLDKSAECMGDVAVQHIENEKANNRLDNLNLLYVAFTRPVQRLYVIGKKGKAEKPNVLRDFLAGTTLDKTIVSSTDEVEIVRFGEERFRNSEENQSNEGADKMMPDSVSMEWFNAVSLDPMPAIHTHDSKILPREWGELMHQILAEILTVEYVDTVLKHYLDDGSLDMDSVTSLNTLFHQMAAHPEIGEAFSGKAKVKNECEILFNGEIIRPDRYAELPEVIYLLDYKTGKKEEKYKIQIQRYANALRELTDKEIRAFLVYLSDSINIEQVH